MELVSVNLHKMSLFDLMYNQLKTHPILKVLSSLMQARPWTPEASELKPTLKLKHSVIKERTKLIVPMFMT